VADAGDARRDGDAAELVRPRVPDGSAATEVDADDPADVVIGGDELAADEQPTTRRPATMAVAKLESEEHIRCPPDGVWQ